MRFEDIPPLTRSGSYAVDVPWKYVPGWLESVSEGMVFETDPDFQRAHVWNDHQRSRYVEYRLRGGIYAKDLWWNCPGWMCDFTGPMQLVDGKQRLTAVLMFLRDELPAFGHLRSEYVGPMGLGATFTMHVNDLPTRAEVLTWYLDLNDGGVAHTEEEIARVRALLEREKGK